jgi:peroxiredoxin
VCQFTFPYLEQLHQSSRQSDVQFVAIAQDGARDTREYMDEFGCTFPALMDERDAWPVSNAYGISHVPSLFIVERDGRISQSWSGWVKADMESLAKRLSVALFGDDEYVPAWKAG